MPYVDLHCEDDYASIFYTTNTTHGNVSGFSPAKPSIIILHPFFLDSTWLQHQLGDPRISSSYNVIAFDMRVCGKSSARPSARHDAWVEAADLAFCHQALHLPPCHIFALEGLSCNSALRFAILFPEMCLSLTLCNVPPPTELAWVITAYDGLLSNWCCAEDLESFEQVANEAVTFLLGQDCDADIRDDVVAFCQTNMGPGRIMRIAETMSVVTNRTPLKPEVLASITHPVLLLHGERNELCPKVHAQKLASQLTNSEGGAVLYSITGASGTLSIVPWYASIANKVFTNFLSRLPPAKSELSPPETSVIERMRTALAYLAELMGDATIASRNPVSSLSFSCLSQEVVKRQTEALREYRKGVHKAFSPLGPDGRPIRKYSERTNEHWFHGGKDGLSHVSNEKFFQPGQSKDQHRERTEKPKAPQEPTTTETRLRRNTTTFNPTTVDKQVIKGMAKVVGAPTAQFQRLIV